MNPILQKIGTLGVVPVVTIEKAEEAIPLARALVAGGLPCAEITFRTAAAAEAIRLIAADNPTMIVGAGTVLSIEQAQTAINAGAKFIVTPGFDATVVDYCLKNYVPITPGVITPTEINMALNKGLRLLKFFPAEAAGGVNMLQALSAPFGHVRFMPTGGINLNNLDDYLSVPSVHACGGSWLVSRKLINAGDFAAVTNLASEAVARVKAIREAIR